MSLKYKKFEKKNKKINILIIFGWQHINIFYLKLFSVFYVSIKVCNSKNRYFALDYEIKNVFCQSKNKKHNNLLMVKLVFKIVFVSTSTVI